MKLYAVFDTNVLVSSMISHFSDSATVKVVGAIMAGVITPLYNQEILSEYRTVLRRKKFNLLDRDVDFITETIVNKGIDTERTASGITFIDESNSVFYEVALSKESSYLITCNIKHFPQTPIVVTPSEMLEIIAKK